MPSPRARSVLIVTGSHLCRNPRVLKEATTLSDAGLDVTVLGVRSHPPSVPLDATLLRDARFRHVAIDLLPGSGVRAFTNRARQWLARRAVRTCGLQAAHALGPCSTLLDRARNLPADLTIVHTEPALWVGVHLLADGRRVAADFEDWHSEDLLPRDRDTRPLPLLQKIEATLLRHGTYVTTTSHALAQAFHARHGGPLPRVITNSFPLQPPPPVRDTSRPTSFFWFSQTIGPGRGLEAFLDAWALTRLPSRLVLQGAVDRDYAARLLSLLPPDRRASLEFHPPTPPAALPAAIAGHDIGLALEESSIVNRDLTITNKILQYLNAGLAIVATDTAGQREVLSRSPDAGLILPSGSPAATASILDALLGDRPALRHRQLAARRLAETVYCWEREQPALLELVARTLSVSSPASV